MSKHPEWPEEVRDQARELYLEAGPTVAAEVTGIPVGTIKTWSNRYDWTGQRKAYEAKQRAAAVGVSIAESEEAARQFTEWLTEHRTGIERRRAENLSEIVDQIRQTLAKMDEPGVWVTKDGDEVEIPRSARDIRDFSIAIGVLIDKMRLELGEATERTEVISPDRIAEEINRLESELALNDG